MSSRTPKEPKGSKEPKGPKGTKGPTSPESRKATRESGGNAPDDIGALMIEIERAWYERRDHRAVDILAKEHPQHARQLYEFFALVVNAREGYGKRRPELAEHSKRTRDWLRREGFAIASAARGAGRTRETTSTTPVRRVSEPGAGTSEQAEERRVSLVTLLKDRTGERKPKVLADELGISLQFLVLVSEHSTLLTPGARSEIAKRVKRTRGIDTAETMRALEGVRTAVQKAASRNAEYGASKLTYEDLVHQAGFEEKEKKFWLSLK